MLLKLGLCCTINRRPDTNFKKALLFGSAHLCTYAHMHKCVHVCICSLLDAFVITRLAHKRGIIYLDLFTSTELVMCMFGCRYIFLIKFCHTFGNKEPHENIIEPKFSSKIFWVNYCCSNIICCCVTASLAIKPAYFVLPKCINVTQAFAWRWIRIRIASAVRGASLDCREKRNVRRQLE